MFKFGSANVAISVPVKDLERLFDFILAIAGVFIRPRHHREEFIEVDRPTPIHVHPVDIVPQISLSEILA